MVDSPRTADVIIVQSRIVPYTLLLLCCLLIIATAVSFTFTDFDSFYVVGKMVWRGSLESAYASAIKIQLKIIDAHVLLPWAYPPQYDFVAAAIALLPERLGYFIFITATFISYIFVLRRLAAEYFGVVILAIIPTLFMTIKCGQNGLLTGALVGLFCLSFRQGRSRAGLSLGLMVIKPHLAVGLAILSLVSRRWGVLAIAAFVVALTSLLAMIVFGAHIWPAFIGGLAQSAKFLKLGYFPFFRMTSVYAVAMMLGLSAGLSFFIQSIVALSACWSVYYAYAQKWGLETIIGISVMASLLVSPYNYDYDMPIFGIALALLIPGIIANTTGREKVILLGCSWIACGWGLFQSLVQIMLRHASIHVSQDKFIPLAGISLLVIFVMVLRIAARTSPRFPR